MDAIAEHSYHHIMRYHEEYNVAETDRRIFKVYWSDALKERVVRKWFPCWKFSIKDVERLGRERWKWTKSQL